jgi:riboflavin synthase
MFTGLVESVGTVRALDPPRASDLQGLQLEIATDWNDLRPGESISVSGVCLTVKELREGGILLCDAMSTTLGRTTIEGWRAGRRVNLERALKFGDRLGGHLLQGHVDCVGRVLRVAREDSATLVDIRVPEETADLMAARGSVGVDGVSLTVNAIPARDVFQVSLIDFTLKHTSLGDLAAGDEVNVEADMVARHVRRLLGPYLEKDGTR